MYYVSWTWALLHFRVLRGEERGEMDVYTSCLLTDLLGGDSGVTVAGSRCYHSCCIFHGQGKGERKWCAIM